MPTLFLQIKGIRWRFLRWMNLLLCSLLAHGLFAQIPGLKVYSQLDGFPGFEGYIMHQDNRGFLWIGTDNGVTCFDGQSFESFPTSMGKPDEEILMAVPDTNNRVLLVPLLNNFTYLDNGERVSAIQDPSLAEIRNRQLNQPFWDEAAQKVWVGDIENRGGLFHWGKDSMQWVPWNIPNAFTVYQIHNQQALVLLSSNTNITELGNYDLNKHQLTSFQCQGQPSFPAFKVVRKNASGNRLVALLPEKEIQVYSQIDSSVWALTSQIALSHSTLDLVIDQQGHLWALRENSGTEYWGPVEQLKDDTTPQVWLPHAKVNHVFVDDESNVWMTTKHHGLAFLSAQHRSNPGIFIDWPSETGQVQAVDYHPQLGLVLGHYSAPALSILKHGEVQLIPEAQPLAGGVSCLLSDTNRVWFAGKERVYAVESQLGKPLIKHTFQLALSVKDLASFGEEGLLVATHNEAFLLNWQRNTSANLLYTDRSTCIAWLPDSCFLIGTPNGLKTKVGLSGEVTPVLDPRLGFAYITDIAVAAPNSIWVATSSQGVFRWNPLADSIEAIPGLSGSRTGHIHRLVLTENQGTWLATNRGVFRVEKTSSYDPLRISQWTFHEGLPANKVTDLVVHHDTLFAATPAGMGIFPLHQSGKPRFGAPRIWIRQATHDSITYRFPSQLEFLAPQSEVVIQLSGISYRSLGKIQYRYRLKGLHPRWITTSNPEVRLSDLPPGKYLFEAVSINAAGRPSTIPASLVLLVKPAWWQTWWFQGTVLLIALVAICGLLVFFVKRFQLKLLNEARQQRRLAELELEAIKAQINPHFIFNCLNSIQLLNRQGDQVQSRYFLDLFARLIRQTMHYSQETFIPLHAEKEYLNDYLNLEKMRFKEQLNFRIEVDTELSPNLLLPAMLVQPYVENAIKHGIRGSSSPGEIKVFFAAQANGTLRVSIEDDGPGLPNNLGKDAPASLGLRLSGSRAETYNQLFQLNLQISFAKRPPGTGTEVEILIPPITHAHTQL